MITCLTPPISDGVIPATVLVKFDGGAIRRLTSQTFTYYKDPVVYEVTPRESYRRYKYYINNTSQHEVYTRNMITLPDYYADIA